LIAIAQIHAAPCWWLADLRVWPFTVWQIDWRERSIFRLGIDHHDVELCLAVEGFMFISPKSQGKSPGGP